MTRSIWLETVVAAVLVAGMVTCLVVSGVALAEMAAPSWNGTYLVLFCAFVVIEAFVSYAVYRRYHFYISGGGRYRLIEVAILLVLFELTADVAVGRPPFENGFPRIDLVALGLFVVILVVRGIATTTASDLDTLRREAETVGRAAAWKDSGRAADAPISPSETIIPAVRGMTQRFFAGGVLLFILAGLTQAQNARFLHVSRPDLTGPIINVLIYFTLGMIMLVTIRYATQAVQWAAAQAVVAPALSGRWIRYSAVFLAAAALFAFLLPAGYAMDLLGMARSGLENALSMLGSSVAHLMAQLGFRPQTTQVPPALRHHPPIQPPHGLKPPPHQRPTGNLTWLLVARAVLFWLAVVGLAVYLMRGYLRQGGPRRAGPRQLQRLVAWLGSLWDRLRRRARHYVDAARDLIPTRHPEVAREIDVTTPRRSRFSRLSPRERIVYYFLSIVRRLERQGRRGQSQTALELEAQIGPTLAEAQGDMRQLTQAYLEARYSAHPIGETEATTAQTHWQRVRAALRRLQT